MSRLQSAPDEQLVKGYLKGDIQCFRILYDRYQSRLFFLVKRFFRNSEQADEVFQEVFLKAIRKLDTFSEQGSFKAWLFTLARNHCIDSLRSAKRIKETSESALGGDDENEAPSFLSRQASSEAASDTLAYDHELSEKLAEALQHLPAEQMEVFVLKERWGMTFEEIASESGASVNTIKSRMRYALQTLRRNLKQKAFVKEAQA